MLDEIGDKENIPDVHRGGEGGPRPADGLRPPGVQVVRPAGQAHQAGGGRGLRARPGSTPSWRSPWSWSGSRCRTTTSSSGSCTPTSTSTRGSSIRRWAIPTEYFTVLFALGRMPGWLAQWEEMLLDKDQKIARPRQIYTGKRRSGRSSPSRSAQTHERPARHAPQRTAAIPPDRGVRRRGRRPRRRCTPRARTGSASGRARRRPWSGSARGPGARLAAAARQVVRRRQAQRRRSTASTGTCAARGEQGRASSGRASRATAGSLTYRDLAREVSRCANALKRLGVKKGDRVAIYLPMIPEAAIAMLACARIGAVHSVVFGGFSAESLRDRINDAGPSRSSPPTAATGAARSCRSSAWPTRRWRRRPRSRTASWSAAGRRRGRRVVRRR